MTPYVFTIVGLAVYAASTMNKAKKIRHHSKAKKAGAAPGGRVTENPGRGEATLPPLSRTGGTAMKKIPINPRRRPRA